MKAEERRLKNVGSKYFGSIQKYFETDFSAFILPPPSLA